MCNVCTTQSFIQLFTHHFVQTIKQCYYEIKWVK
jgi:hypothetical protein